MFAIGDDFIGAWVVQNPVHKVVHLASLGVNDYDSCGANFMHVSSALLTSAYRASSATHSNPAIRSVLIAAKIELPSLTYGGLDEHVLGKTLSIKLNT
jgi:hypothetical protein